MTMLRERAYWIALALLRFAAPTGYLYQTRLSEITPELETALRRELAERQASEHVHDETCGFFA